MRANGYAGPDHDDSGKRDLAYRLVAATVALMRPGRRDWGLAMLAELDHVPRPGERAWFALGAVQVALFPSRATRPWWTVSVGLIVRAVVAGAAIHALAPAGGLAVAALAALPAAGAWRILTMPVPVDRLRGAALVGQVTVAAGVVGCLALFLTVIQHYPQVMGTGMDHGWVAGVVFDVASAGYLAIAWLLPRRFPDTRRNILYALTAGLVVAAAAAQYIAQPSLIRLWMGPVPGNSEYLLACLALPAATALAVIRRGSVNDGVETATWAALLASLTTSIMIIAATYRVAPSADGSRPIIADAHLHGMTSASAWLVSDNLGGASFLLIFMPVVFLGLAGTGALLGCVLRASAARVRG